jgi:Cysteine rich repeat
MVMIVRHLKIASLLSLALLSLPGGVLAAGAGPLDDCKADVGKLCPGVEPGGGRIVACLKEHKTELSAGCAKALQEVMEKMKGEMGK